VSENSGEGFTILAEWTIRKLRKIDFEKADEEEIIRWVLYSLGIEKLGQDIYLYLREKGSATSTEIAEKFGISPATARKYLEQLHLVGLVDYIGREYHLSFEELDRSLRSILLPRINDVLRTVLRVASLLRKRGIPEEVLPLELQEEGLIDLAGKLGEKMRKIEEKARKLLWSGIKVEEEGEFVVMKIFRNYVLSNNILTKCAEKGKKLVMHVFGPLKISDDLDPSLASSVIERIVVYGSVTGPRKVLSSILDRLEVYGSLSMR